MTMTILKQEMVNTGGNCMVMIAAVKEKNDDGWERTVYAHVDEEGWCVRRYSTMTESEEEQAVIETDADVICFGTFEATSLNDNIYKFMLLQVLQQYKEYAVEHGWKTRAEAFPHQVMIEALHQLKLALATVNEAWETVGNDNMALGTYPLSMSFDEFESSMNQWIEDATNEQQDAINQ